MALHPVVRQKMTRLLALVLVIEIIVIAVIWLVVPGVGLTTEQKRQNPTLASSAIPLSARQDLNTFSASAERPIFFASRRPAPAGIAAAGPAIRGKGAILGRYRLTGVVVSSTVKIAFIRDMVGNRNMALKIGEKLDDWVFEDIKKHSITLVSGKRREVFQLRKTQPR